MRLGILIYSLSGGGAERVVSYLVSYCVSNNIDVHLILMNPTIKYNVPKSTKIHYIEKSDPSESGIKKALKIPVLAYKYAKLVKELKLTHSLSFLTRPSFINVIASKLTSYKFKVITNERAFPSLQYSYKGFQSSFNKTLIKSLYKKSDLVISNSYGNAGDLVDNFEVPSEKMKVIHNPIDLGKIENTESNLSFFDSEKYNIITLGRLDIGKNHEMLIRAIHQLQNPILHLYIFGVGDLHEHLEKLIEELGLKEQVFLMGFSPNPYQYLKSADLFIFGSNHEGFPNVLLEAMACDLPILSTNCQSGPSEIMELKTVKEDIMITDYGILVPIKNTDLMAKGISYFVENSNYAETCKTNSKSRIKDFEKDTILKKYIDLINSTTIAN
ncbi:N-acetylgalactosamine-N,N'-diacetylbacillosaminyl-diphospho-undecaprenol 4-alpha-N-acetylgalactosaminyltransferase [Winogradskyella eximia]|uniref:N-acetylgalactosamine-N, N'-diacetylbacillosaminyl-diphospho-undecaprenol 4-alpha-N-acetylgalactosaminyltransferase n=1 Tax=Winogradskyella eximia TaxID=262006 RepID=A0A3D9H8Q8_9FLAO|nr:glycosyltransferase [Winogradskyella eximia]RED45346.1 N-acetylgalactosamine-N,N'-diacetylbacillosaminyl-diphospho-undecaprenol 4-alpha-N-acetylgalactosaminyltransferase [Winogradskyella eximia]